MSVPAPLGSTRKPPATACAGMRAPGALHPPVVPADADVPGTVERVHDTITGAGGTVVPMADHSAPSDPGRPR